jgi:hypothetical protein
MDCPQCKGYELEATQIEPGLVRQRGSALAQGVGHAVQATQNIYRCLAAQHTFATTTAERSTSLSKSPGREGLQ